MKESFSVAIGRVIAYLLLAAATVLAAGAFVLACKVAWGWIVG